MDNINIKIATTALIIFMRHQEETEGQPLKKCNGGEAERPGKEGREKGAESRQGETEGSRGHLHLNDKSSFIWLFVYHCSLHPCTEYKDTTGWEPVRDGSEFCVSLGQKPISA